MTDPRHPAPITHPEPGEAFAGDRGEQSGVNLQQSRAIGQDPPEEGSRMSREKLKHRATRARPTSPTTPGRTRKRSASTPSAEHSSAIDPACDRAAGDRGF